MRARTCGLAQSEHTRLVRHAQALGVDVNLLLTRFATERLLYRLSCSRHAERFVLKGGLLMLAWFGDTIRPTRDADLLGFGDMSDEALADIFREVCDVEVAPDAMVYLKGSVRAEAIRPEDTYGGCRVTLRAQLGSAQLRVQVDVGLGDAVLPLPEWLEYPSLLGLPRPRLRAYRPETVIAEKVHVMVLLGAHSSRMRDFFDVYTLARLQPFDGEVLVSALRVTFERRHTAIPCGSPLALTPEFGAMEEKRAQWGAFLKRNRLTSVPDDFSQVTERLAQFMEPVLSPAGTAAPSPKAWNPGGPWRRVQPQAGATVDA